MVGLLLSFFLGGGFATYPKQSQQGGVAHGPLTNGQPNKPSETLQGAVNFNRGPFGGHHLGPGSPLNHGAFQTFGHGINKLGHLSFVNFKGRPLHTKSQRSNPQAELAAIVGSNQVQNTSRKRFGCGESVGPPR